MAVLFRYCILALLAFLTPLGAMDARAQNVIEQDQYAAIILAYHRVGEDQNPSASIRIDQFRDHIAELTQEDYNVLPLPAIVEALANRTNLPPRSVAISFDGGHRSVLEEAVPLLLEKRLPFTIFVAPGMVDQQLPHYMDWDDLRRLNRNKLVTIGIHSQYYARLSGEPENEIARQINNAKSRFREELKTDPVFFAYPFGEYSLPYRDVVARSGFSASFGQQSGVAYAGMDLHGLPRFSMTEAFGNMDRFRLTTSALPLPVHDLAPADPHITETDVVQLGFTLAPSLQPEIAALSCFAAGYEDAEMQVIGGGRVELRLPALSNAGRTRVNCTMPGPKKLGEDNEHWRWFGLLLSGPSSDDDDEWDQNAATPLHSAQSQTE